MKNFINFIWVGIFVFSIVLWAHIPLLGIPTLIISICIFLILNWEDKSDQEEEDLILFKTTRAQSQNIQPVNTRVSSAQPIPTKTQSIQQPITKPKPVPEPVKEEEPLYTPIVRIPKSPPTPAPEIVRSVKPRPAPEPKAPPKSSQSKYDNKSARNQARLEKYINKHHDHEEIGRIYERQIGYMLEQEGYEVT